MIYASREMDIKDEILRGSLNGLEQFQERMDKKSDQSH